MTYRAAYLPQLVEDGRVVRGEICLTTPAEAETLTDEGLVLAALREAQEAGLDITAEDLEIGDWTE